MEKNPDGSRPWRRRVVFMLIVDILIWFIAAFPVLFLFLLGTPYSRGFFCDDTSLSYPYRLDSVQPAVLITGGFATSALAVVLVEVLNSLDRKCRPSCPTTDDIVYCITGYAVFLVGFVIQQVIVEVVKIEMGVLRPNFFDVCKPYFNRSHCPGYITEYTCTGNDVQEVRESRQSFPSGHSAFSMYVAAFYCLYIQQRLEIRFSCTLKFFLQAGLLFISTLCGLSRLKDNKHHPADVIAGFLLGIIVAVFVYNMIGKKVMTSPQITCSDNMSSRTTNNTHDCCCACTRTPESQIPSPLLKNEFLNIDNEQTTKAPLLRDPRFPF